MHLEFVPYPEAPLKMTPHCLEISTALQAPVVGPTAAYNISIFKRCSTRNRLKLSDALFLLVRVLFLPCSQQSFISDLVPHKHVHRLLSRPLLLRSRISFALMRNVLLLGAASPAFIAMSQSSQKLGSR